MSLLKKHLALACLSSLVAPSAWAQAPEAIKASIERLTQGKVKVESVQATPAAGIYQVVSEGEIFYSDATGRFGLVGGALVDMQSQKDLTAPAQAKLSAIPFSSLPLQHAIKEVHGNGTRKMAVFEDPNCPICRVFTKFVDQLPDVTVYRFMFPVIDPSSQQYAVAAWCSADRASAWRSIMAGARPEPADKCDISGLADILKFGEKHKILNTPTVFLGNGKRLVGATPPDQFVAELDASGKP